MPKAQPKAKLDDELDRLYRLPLEEFTAERNALARELRKAGDREEADRVKALPKPSISAWVVNQLARRERLQMRALVSAGERLRKAQEKLFRGGEPKELQEATERQREVVAALMDSARAILRSAGHPTTEATLERVRGTLSAAAGDEEGLVPQGRLSEDLDPTGFGPLALGTGAGRRASKQLPKVPAGDKRKPAAESHRKETEARKERIDEARRDLDALRAQVNEQTARARRAQAEATKAAQVATASKKAAEKEEKQLEQLRGRLEAAKEALERARAW